MQSNANRPDVKRHIHNNQDYEIPRGFQEQVLEDDVEALLLIEEG